MIGSKLGPYEITAKLGEGGMGEVFKARDTRLDRVVAIKVLASHVAASADLRARFDREARAISQLQHPHICTLFDVGHQDGTDFLVMELLDGESLADRLTKGPLPMEQTLRFGTQIAEALDGAHKQGIIHRDLKPGNVMLTKSGVKLLDFGLAKLQAAPAPSSAVAGMPTQLTAEKPLTGQGTLLGTFQYMAPEQLEGKEADTRTDLWALGCVVYEMATGQKAFSGKSQASLIGAIMNPDPPPISAIRPLTPPLLDRLVRTCLAKDRDDRFQTAHDVAIELRWMAEGASRVDAPAVAGSRGSRRERVAWTVAAILALALAASLVSFSRRAPVRMVQSSILPPEKSDFVFEGGPMALSPDGTRLALVAAPPEGEKTLWVRPLNAAAAESIVGTEDASYPFWSPDSRFLGFFAGGKLKRIDASGGPPQVLCEAQSGRGGTWNRDGAIVFSPSGRSPLMRVSAAGGTPVPLSEIDVSKGELSHRFPFFLPDGRHFLYLAFASKTGDTRNAAIIYAGALDSKERKLLVRVQSNAVYAPSSIGSSSGYLIFAREKTVVAQPFDPQGLSFAGEAVPIGAAVTFFDNIGLAVFTASSTGTFAYQSRGAGALSQLMWFDRRGNQLGVLGAAADYLLPRISHDGRRVAVAVVDPQTGQSDVWILDVQRQAATRLTFGSPGRYSPVWSPDDRQLAFSSRGAFYQKASSGTGEEEVLAASDGNSEGLTDWSRDGKFLIYSALGAGAKASWDIFNFSFAEKKRVPVLATPWDEYSGVVSPDLRWLAYVSEESGKPQVYVQSFPAANGKWQVSTAGGDQPSWGLDGREIFFLAPHNKLMAVPVKTSPDFEAGTPQVLFETRIGSEGGRTPGRRYDVSADGRFLISTAMGETRSLPITLVQNWATGLKEFRPSSAP